jgi:predicted permease
MLHDLTHACRMLLHTKGWTAVVLLSLALGIGANTALFTAVNGLMLQDLAVPEPDGLVRVKWAGENDMRRNTNEYGFSHDYRGMKVTATFPHPAYLALREANQTMTDLAAFSSADTYNVVVNGTAEIASAFVVSGNFFSVVRVPMAIGRGIVEADNAPNAPPVAVISQAFWRRRFGSDEKVVGQTVRMNNTPVTIVGVTGATFTGVMRLGTTAPDVTVPIWVDTVLNPSQAARMNDGTSYWLLLMGRLKPGATYDQIGGNLGGPFQASAREGMAGYLAGLSTDERQLEINQKDGTRVPQLFAESGRRGSYDADQTSRRSAAIVSVVVVLLLLIVCANVANLLLSRATARSRELSVRLAMGASRGRLIRQLLTESLLLSGIGGVLGIIVGYWSKSLLPFGENASIDARVIGFVTAVSVLTGVVFGLLPAFRATRVDLAGAMKETGRSVVASRSWLSKALLVVQVAVSLVLLIGAGLFLQTLNNLKSVDVGFNADNLVMFRINPQLNRYSPEQVNQLLVRMRSAFEALPGVRAMAVTRTPLLSGGRSTTSVHIQGQTGRKDMHAMSVSPEFFATMEIPVLVGRGFAAHDAAAPGTTVMINETAAKLYFANTSPIGSRFGFSPETAGKMEIIGVIKDTKYASLREPAPPTLYQTLPASIRAVTVVVRTAGNPSAMTETLRAAMHQVDPDVPLTAMTTQTDQIEARVSQERLFALAYSLFGGLALLLACIGLFGLMSYSVSRRTNEIGIRMALGAQRSGVVGMVLRESMVMVAAGVIIGVAAALAAGRLVATVLFGLSPADVWTIAGAVLLMTAVSLAAGYLPARRAARVDPMTALRYE